MAKTLPAIEITDAQYTRVGAVLPGANAAEKGAAYEQMVRAMLRGLVVDNDIRAAIEANADELEAARQAAVDHADNL